MLTAHLVQSDDVACISRIKTHPPHHSEGGGKIALQRSSPWLQTASKSNEDDDDDDAVNGWCQGREKTLLSSASQLNNGSFCRSPLSFWQSSQMRHNDGLYTCWMFATCVRLGWCFQFKLINQNIGVIWKFWRILINKMKNNLEKRLKR